MSSTQIEQFRGFAQKKLAAGEIRAAQAVLDLAAEGATVPFIARYRKEKTGNLDEVQIRNILDTHSLWVELTARKDFVLKEIEKQGALTEEIKRSVLASAEMAELEELYRPFKRKKKTKAKMARDAGLEPLANWLWAMGHGEIDDKTALEVKAKEFINPAAGFATYEEAMRGAQHIIAENLYSNPELRQQVKDHFWEKGALVSAKGEKYKPNSKYQMYAEYREIAKNLMSEKTSHRYLALRRGWQEEELKVSIEGDEESLLKSFEAFSCSRSESVAAFILKSAAKVALTVHVIPSITNEMHTLLKEQADRDAVKVFAENVRRVLLASPFGPKVVLGVDPGLRTGCKVALVDKSGNHISHTVMDILGNDAHANAVRLLGEVFKQIQIEAIAVGNGTGGRETETFIRKVIKEIGRESTPVILVNESGASVYSASDVAREEFPDLDLTVRGAISIARRLQDPLAELVKIDPKSIGVGQYQHDVGQNQLKKGLHEVVESCVNRVGVDVNTASVSLLQYVAGIGPGIARNIIEFRRKNGLLQERDDLLKVPHLSSKVFEQAAGFLRLPESKQVLDRTGVHPERYKAVREMAQETGVPISQLIGPGAQKLQPLKEKWSALIGEYTFEDIVRELEKPGRDPRDPFKIFQFREDIHEVRDLKKDMICPGVVTNVTNFGAFVDIGVHQDGLVHISELSHDFVNDPKQVVSPGDQVQVKVLDVDLEKNQVALTMILEPRREVRAPRPRAEGEARPERKAQGSRPQNRRDEGRQQQAKGGRPDGHKGKSGKPTGGGRPSGPARPERKPFNNPFAALTQIKK